MLTRDVCYSLVQCQTYWWTAGIQNLIPLGHPVRGGGDYNFTDPSQAQNLSITKFFRPNSSTVFTSQRQTERQRDIQRDTKTHISRNHPSLLDRAKTRRVDGATKIYFTKEKPEFTGHAYGYSWRTEATVTHAKLYSIYVFVRTWVKLSVVSVACSLTLPPTTVYS